MTSEQLRERLVELNDAGNAIMDMADHEQRELTAEERQQLDALHAAFEEALAADNRQRRERIQAQAQRLRDYR